MTLAETDDLAVKIIIYEDNADYGDALRILFSHEKDIELLSLFTNCSTVKEDIEALKPEVILMDIDMPGMNGIEAVRKIRQFNKVVDIIMVTIFDRDEHIFKALQAGATGYLLKTSSPDKIKESIKEVHNGGAPMSAGIARKVMSFFAGTGNTSAEADNLSIREKEVLGLLVKGYSYKMIAASLHISINTVSFHIKKIYEKLHVNSMSEAVAKAIQGNLLD